MEKTLNIDDLPFWPARKKETNKYDYGHVLIVAGSLGYLGAPALSGRAAYRTGAGLVTAMIPQNAFPFFDAHTPELMVRSYGTLIDIETVIDKKNVVIFGPGLGPDDAVNTKILQYLLARSIPMVIDAGGFVYFVPYLATLSDLSRVVVTPHTGEAKRLFPNGLEDIKKAVSKGLTVVLKSATTRIYCGSEIWIADAGNPGMATAGSGDVLSGMIGALIGQGRSLAEAAKLGVYLHQEAGHLAAKRWGEDGMMASDIIECIPQAIVDYKKER